MLEQIKFLIPNLDRRSDRWEFMRQMLLDQGVPQSNIERFTATDGLDYLDADKNHLNSDLLKTSVDCKCHGASPAFIANDHKSTLTHLAWKWTWYNGLQSIAKNTHIVCWMIDDYKLHINYETLLIYMRKLMNAATSRSVPFLGVQLSRCDDNHSRMPVEGCPEFQHGFGSNADAVVVYSPSGAKRGLELADNMSRQHYADPWFVAAEIKQLDDPGWFGLSDDNMASLCDHNSLMVVSEKQEYSDRVISEKDIETRSIGVNRINCDIYGALPQIKDFPIYADADPTTAVVIRLFSHLEYPALATKMTHVILWSMRSHILNSDMISYKPTPIFHVEEKHFARTRHIFDMAGIPEANIIVYPNDLVSTRSDIFPQYHAASPFLDPQLERFERVIVVDGDSFSMSNARSGPVPLMELALNRMPQDSLQIWRSWEVWNPEDDEYQCWYERAGLGREGWIETAARYANTTPDRIRDIMYPPDPQNTSRPWHNGAFMNIPMNWLKANGDFRAFIKEVSGTMGDEEIALAVWYMKHYLETSQKLPDQGLQNIVWDNGIPLNLVWDADAAWAEFRADNPDPSFLHLYEFNNIGIYGSDWAEAVGGSYQEAGQFSIAVRAKVAETWKQLECSPTVGGADSKAQGLEAEHDKSQTFPSPVHDELSNANTFDFQPFSLRNDDAIQHVANDVLAVCEAVAKENRGEQFDGSWVVQHSVDELQALYEIAARMHDTSPLKGHVLQCGILCGGSALMLAQALKDTENDVPVLAIDSYTKFWKPLRREFDWAYHEWRENRHEFRMDDHLTAVISTTQSVLKHFWSQPIRLVFIDSSHLYKETLEELALLFPHIVNQGWLVLHDYFNKDTVGVTRAMNEFLESQNVSTFNFYRMDQLAIIRLNAPPDCGQSPAQPERLTHQQRIRRLRNIK